MSIRTEPSAFIPPTTSNFADGIALPIPTLPVAVMRSLSPLVELPLVENVRSEFPFPVDNALIQQ